MKKKGKFAANFMKFWVMLSAILTIGVLILLIIYILAGGIPHLNADMFSIHYTTENLSMFPAIINTFFLTALSLLAAVPIGIITAIYLTEYADPTSQIIRYIRLTTQTLAGIPSIVYGLFGFLFFVVSLGMSYTIIGGALTLGIMILPLIIRTTEEALLAVPKSYRLASYGLGATKTRTIYKIVLPAARKGILSGIILSIGRIVGETIALIYTSGTVAQLASSPMDSGRTLSVHMYRLLSEGLYMDEAAATGAILLVIVFIMNYISTKVVD